MHWTDYQEEEGFYLNVPIEKLNSLNFNDLSDNSIISTNLPSGELIYLTRINNQIKITVDNSTNVKFVEGLFTWYTYISTLTTVLKTHKQIEILETNTEPNHYGISFAFYTNQFDFLSVLEKIEETLNQLEKEVKEQLIKDFPIHKKEFMGTTPFDIKIDKETYNVTVLVDYEIINRKYWTGILNIKELLTTHQELVSTFPIATILDYQIEDPTGMTLKYQLSMTKTTTEEEVQTWIDTIEDYIIRKAYTKLVDSQ